MINSIILLIQALLDTLELQASAGSKGHFALYNCLVLGHTKYKEAGPIGEIICTRAFDNRIMNIMISNAYNEEIM